MSGLAGHMLNPYEDLSLTYGELNNLITDSISGKLKFIEKTDGFNVHILNNGGTIKIARSKKDLEVGGIGLDELKTRFKAEHARVNFELAIKLAAGLENILDEYDGHITYNCEVLNGKLNLIDYGTQRLIIHGRYDWNDNTEERVDIEGFTLKPVQFEPLEIGVSLPVFEGTLGDYYFEHFKMRTTCDDRKVFDRLMAGKKLLKNQQEWAFIEQDWTATKYSIVSSIEIPLIALGDMILQNVKGLNGPVEEDFSWIQDDGLHFHRIYLPQTRIEGVVFDYNGKEYKWTGSFAPLNKLNFLRK